MRIIAGEKRGLKLISQKGTETRPTLDRVKEAMFGRLQFELKGKHVLDLFAGSGALGLEALSRGAQDAVFVDNDDDAGSAVKHNIKAAQMEDRAVFIKNDYVDAMKLFQNKRKFDIVLIDPPYKSGFYGNVLRDLSEYGLLAVDAVVVAESDAPIEYTADGYRLEKQKKYGKTFLTFFRWKEE